MGEGGPVIWKILAGALAVSLAFSAWQLKRAESLKVQLSEQASQIVLLQSNLSDILKDRMRDEKIDNLADDELRDLAVRRGWLRSDNPGP